MARKKKHEEHENLERWLVSYADFMTLLFATFVVLYALSQVDVAKFTKLGQSLHGAFTQSVLEGSEGIMDSNGQSVLDSSSSNSIMDSLIFEYLNPQYEQEGFDDIQKEIKSSKDLKDVQVEQSDRGLIISFTDEALQFEPGSAKLTSIAKTKLDKIGSIIGQKFLVHMMRVEGHTDNIPFANAQYPSNWELSAARSGSVARYLMGRFKFSPDLFTIVGFADTRPKAPNNNPKNRAKNRSVDIVILKNQYRTLEDSRDKMVSLDKKEQKQKREQQLQTINAVMTLSDAAKQLTDDANNAQQVIKLKGN